MATNRKPSSPAWSLVSGLLIALMQWVVLACMGVSFNKELQAWQHFCMKLLLGGTVIYVATSIYILVRRIPTRGDLRFIRCGFVMPLILEFMALVLQEISRR